MPRDPAKPPQDRPQDPYAAPPPRRSTRLADHSSRDRPSHPPSTLASYDRKARDKRPGPTRRRSSHDHDSKHSSSAQKPERRSHRSDPHPSSRPHRRDSRDGKHGERSHRSHRSDRAAPSARKGSTGSDLNMKQVMSKGKQTWQTVQPVAAPMLSALAQKFIDAHKTA